MNTCSKCNRDRVPEGGVFLNPTKWVCAECWLKILNHRRAAKELA
jgi:hypothetical protein